MQDLKAYLSVAFVLSTLWFGILAGLLIEINRLFPDASLLPFLILVSIRFIDMRINKLIDTLVICDSFFSPLLLIYLGLK